MINKTKYETGSGGTILIKENDIQNDFGIFTPVYEALFSTVSEYWANSVFNIKINSETENALTKNSLDLKGIENIKRAIEQDLSNLSFAEFTVTVVLVNSDKLKITIEALNNSTLQIIWDFTKGQIIEFKTI